MELVRRLASLHPEVTGLLRHYLERHAPRTRAEDPVPVPRIVFDPLCLAALAGLESADASRESQAELADSLKQRCRMLEAEGARLRWAACSERLPPLPETPYKVYLVWAVQRVDNATGQAVRAQWGRDGRWVEVYCGLTGRPCDVTHWCDALDVLGTPDPQPYGPRGREVGGGAR